MVRLIVITLKITTQLLLQRNLGRGSASNTNVTLLQHMWNTVKRLYGNAAIILKMVRKPALELVLLMRKSAG
ncbi:MAG TPA: hypothetical protein VIK78_16060 [Ruminiclostridium sp.]